MFSCRSWDVLLPRLRCSPVNSSPANEQLSYLPWMPMSDNLLLTGSKEKIWNKFLIAKTCLRTANMVIACCSLVFTIYTGYVSIKVYDRKLFIPATVYWDLFSWPVTWYPIRKERKTSYPLMKYICSLIRIRNILF